MASEIETLEIFWPTTGLTQTFHNVPVNRFIQIVEGEAQYTTLTVKKLKVLDVRAVILGDRRFGTAVV